MTTKIILCQENVEVYSVSGGIALKDLGSLLLEVVL